MQLLKQKIKTSHPEQYTTIDRMYVNDEFISTQMGTVDDFIKQSTFWPSRDQIPQGLIETAFSEYYSYGRNSLKESSFYFIGIDLNKDDELEFIVIDESNNYTSAYFWLLDSGVWVSKYINVENPEQVKLLKTIINNDEIFIVEPEYSDLKIGDVFFEMPR